VGENAAEQNRTLLYDKLRHATRGNGAPVFSTATCARLLVNYILAAQCLAYIAAFIVYHILLNFA
jgi:hypothetical protein